MNTTIQSNLEVLVGLCDENNKERMKARLNNINGSIKMQIYYEMVRQGLVVPPEYQVICRKCQKFSEHLTNVPGLGYICPKCSSPHKKKYRYSIMLGEKKIGIAEGYTHSEAIAEFGKFCIYKGYKYYRALGKGPLDHQYENDKGDKRITLQPEKRSNVVQSRNNRI